MGLDATCKDTILPLGWLMWTRNTILTRVFFRPMSVSPFRSSMSELRSLRIPAQSILWHRKNVNVLGTDSTNPFRSTKMCIILLDSCLINNFSEQSKCLIYCLNFFVPFLPKLRLDLILCSINKCPFSLASSNFGFWDGRDVVKKKHEKFTFSIKCSNPSSQRK